MEVEPIPKNNNFICYNKQGINNNKRNYTLVYGYVSVQIIHDNWAVMNHQKPIHLPHGE